MSFSRLLGNEWVRAIEYQELCEDLTRRNREIVGEGVENQGRGRSVVASEPNISDDLFARPDKLKIFVSSKMKGRCLGTERLAAIEAIESVSFAEPWCWERNSVAGSVCAEAFCLGHARTSDGLVLIVDDDLTTITRKEYKAAYDRGVRCYILQKDRDVQPSLTVQRFINGERKRGAVTKRFQNVSELRTEVTKSLISHAVDAVRFDIDANRRRRAR